MAKQEFKIGDTAHISTNYFTKIEVNGTFKKIKLKMEDEVKILGVIRTHPTKTSGYMYVTDKGEVPQEKLFPKNLWEKYSYQKEMLEKAESNRN